MKENHPSIHEPRVGGGGGLGSLFDNDSDDELVAVSSGPYEEHLPVQNMTVGEIRARFRARLDIAPESQATLNGQAVGDETRVQAGQMLAFVHRTGEKGTRVRALGRF